jgi:hypothetical protein
LEQRAKIFEFSDHAVVGCNHVVGAFALAFEIHAVTSRAPLLGDEFGF